MPTIVEYSDHKPPTNQYPTHIISPPRAGGCCFSDMEELGTPQKDARWVYQYRRCRRCGFAVRVILREIPDIALMASLRETLAHSFVRNIPD
jgi:ribosomal protein S14